MGTDKLSQSTVLEMPAIKIYYFDFPFWRAEVSRLALHLGNVPFENVKVTFAERDALKEAGKAPLGAFPTMVVDGKIVCQTGAIARYCGKLGGFYPKDDDFAAAKIDEIIDTTTDITNIIGVTMRMKDEQEKLAARKELSTGKLPEILEALEKILTQNGSTGFQRRSSTLTSRSMLTSRRWRRIPRSEHT